MNNINNAGQQPRLCIDLNVAYRAEDDDALNDGRSISQIRVISDSTQTLFSMRHSAPPAQTSIRAPSAQAIEAGKMVVSIEDANPRISVTSSLPSASSSEVRCERPGSQSSGLPFASSHDAGQSGEAFEGRISKNKKYPVPKHLRKSDETDETRILGATLLGRRLVPVPVALRIEGETDQSRISRNALSMRRLVPIPVALRKAGETDQTRISRNSRYGSHPG
ncbi:MAG: hypothetical protein P8104_12130 [Gammaproteobacteria bacterium]